MRYEWSLVTIYVTIQDGGAREIQIQETSQTKALGACFVDRVIRTKVILSFIWDQKRFSAEDPYYRKLAAQRRKCTNNQYKHTNAR